MERVLTLAEPGAVSLAEAMTQLRDHLVAEAEIARAERPADKPISRPGFQTVPMPEELLEQLLAFSERHDAGEAELPPDLAEATLRALRTVPRPAASRPRVDGAASARAAASLGRARMLQQAYVLNDQAPAARIVPVVEQLLGASVPAQLHALIRRTALQVMAEVEREVAQRERGAMPNPAMDPAMALTLARVAVAPTVIPPAPVPAAVSAPVKAAGVLSTASTETVSRLMTTWIDDSRKNRRDNVSEKALRDRAVARDLFAEICGDLPLNEVTRAVCDDFVEQLMAVPAMHGRGEFAKLTARESLELADLMDQDLEQKRGADGRSATVPRLAKGTINKHLSALEGGLAKHMGLPPGASSPIVQARFSKKEVEAAPAFVRRMPHDKLMRGMFHGPLFTGHDDSANRGAPGPHVEQDGKYWVPLLALLSSGCLEELLQLRPCDVYEMEGIWVIDIGAEGARVKTPLRPRMVPVHSHLKRLGFLEYVADFSRKGHALLFPGFHAGGLDKRFGHTFTRFWTEYRRQVGHYARGADLHALRHSVNTRLVNAGVSQLIIRQILGHAQHGMTGKVYNSRIELTACAEAIEKLRYDTCIDWEELARCVGR